ncbi:hypothetical protein NQD34_013591 [Periophthalmus magnuspinnatus]|nr:hypothetical protein NQD34_013591 [Periophthalmus magnuspinnatus]
MRTEPLLLLLLVLCDGRGLTSAGPHIYTAVEGKHFSARFVFYTSGTYKVCCKNDCREKEDMVDTSHTKAQKGRYSIEFEQDSTHHILHYGISNVRSSDSGSYSCEIWSGAVMERSVTFQINVTREPTVISSFNGTSRPTHQTIVTSAVLNETTQNRQPSSEPSNRITLYVTLAAALFLFLVTLSILCWRKRGNKPKELIECTQIPERNHVYEELATGPLQSTVYSLISGHESQSQVEANAETTTYTEMDFTRCRSSSTPKGQTGESAGQNVLYSTITSLQQ